MIPSMDSWIEGHIMPLTHTKEVANDLACFLLLLEIETVSSDECDIERIR